MKRISKLLVLVLALALLAGVIFAVASSAADGEYKTARDAYLKELGVTNTHHDLSDLTLDYHQYLYWIATGNAANIAATEPTNIGYNSGTVNLAQKVSTNPKYGHLRTIVSPSGNAYLDYTFYRDWQSTDSTSSTDSYIASAVRRNLSGVQYYVSEFDMTTRTQYPGNLTVLAEYRVSSETPYDVSGSSRLRSNYGQYDAATGLWTFGDKQVKLEANEWVHITYVLDMQVLEGMTTVYEKVVEETSTTYTAYVTARTDGSYRTRITSVGPDENNKIVTVSSVYAGNAIAEDAGYTLKTEAVKTFNYHGSVGKVYLNGELVATDTTVYSDYEYIEGRAPMQHYVGIGWIYADKHTGRLANDSVIMDNMSDAIFKTDNAALASLFDAENPVTDISNLGYEVAWHEGYQFPAEDTGLASLTHDGKTVMYGTAEAAIAAAKAQNLVGATVTLYGDAYLPVAIDAPVTIDYNGFAFLNGYTLSPELEETKVMTGETETGLAVTALNAKSATKATFQIYNTPWTEGGMGEIAPVSVQYYNVGGLFTTPALGAYLGDATTVYEPTGAWEIRDAQGNVVTMTAVAEEHLGGTYTVCPVMITRTSTVENPAFYTVNGDTVQFYENSVINTALGTNVIAGGTKIVLLADCSITKYFVTGGSATFSLDLNGKHLTCVQLIARAASQNAFIYSSVDGAEITASGDLVYQGGDVSTSSTYFGYVDASTKSAQRIKITAERVAKVAKSVNTKFYFHNVELHTDISTSATEGMFVYNQGRAGRDVVITSCDIYTSIAILSLGANGAQQTMTISDSNIYGSGNAALFYIHTYNASSSACTGTQGMTLRNTNVYDTKFGVDKAVGSKADGTSQTALSSLTVEGNCHLSCEVERGTVADSQQLLVDYQTVTLADKVYTSKYKTASLYARYLSVNVYHMDKASAEEKFLEVEKVAYGATYIPPVAEEQLYPTDGRIFYIPTGEWVAYDHKGATVEIIVNSNTIDNVYNMYPVCNVKETAFATVDQNGDEVRYESNDIIAALGTTTIANGRTIVLYKDCYLVTPLTARNAFIDLNGCALYAKSVKTDLLSVGEGCTLFVYSSAEGARIFTTPYELASGSGYCCKIGNKNATIYIGYKDEQTKCENRIEVYTGAFCEISGDNSGLYLYNLTMIRNGRDNYGYLNFRGGGDTGRFYDIENCDIYSNSAIFCVRGGVDNSTTGDAYIRNCNIYNTNGASGKFVEFYSKENEITPKNVVFEITLENSNVYGGRDIQTIPTYGENCTAIVYVKGDCQLGQINENVKTEDGTLIVPKAGSYQHPGFMVNAGAAYNGAQSLTYKTSFAWYYETVTEKEYLRGVYQNVSLVSDINVNTYIPAWDFIASVTLDGEENLLNVENIATMGDKEYYAIVVGDPAKSAHLAHSLVITFKNGTEVALTASLGDYAKRLLASKSEDAYILDSKELMGYILNYVKATALEYTDASAEEIFADIEYTVDDTVVFEEPTNLSTAAIKQYIEGAALDLDACAGYAFKVAKGFVGTVQIQLGASSMQIEKTYTAEAPAGDNEVIYLENVPAHALRYTITVTVTPEGATESLSATFNLATYVNYLIESENATDSQKAFARAVYTYAVKARAFGVKYSA